MYCICAWIDLLRLLLPMHTAFMEGFSDSQEDLAHRLRAFLKPHGSDVAEVVDTILASSESYMVGKHLKFRTFRCPQNLGCGTSM